MEKPGKLAVAICIEDQLIARLYPGQRCVAFDFGDHDVDRIEEHIVELHVRSPASAEDDINVTADSQPSREAPVWGSD